MVLEINTHHFLKLTLTTSSQLWSLETGTELLNIIWLIPSFEIPNTFSGMTKVLVAIKIEK
jgi:hypothetical protein